MSNVTGAGDGSIGAGWEQTENVEKMSQQGIQQANRTAKASAELEAAKNINKMAKTAVSNAGSLV